jgi:hypothetical protein
LLITTGSRRPRAVLFAFGTVVAACGSEIVVDGSTSTGSSDATTTATSGTQASSSQTSSSTGDGGNIAPPYGIPGGFGGEGGLGGMGGAADGSGGNAIYGAPPPIEPAPEE